MKKTTTKRQNPDQDEQAEGIPYEKGREFEIQFAAFMKSDLGWDKVRVGASIAGHHNPKGTSIDVIGERLDALGIKYRDISTKWMMGSVIFFMGGLLWWFQEWGNNGFWLTMGALMSFLGFSIFRLLSDANNWQNSWVECKNLKGRANVTHIAKMIREFEDYKKSRNDAHRFTHYYFASANGYVENALKMANDNNVVCYVKNGKTFEEVKYWS